MRGVDYRDLVFRAGLQVELGLEETESESVSGLCLGLDVRWEERL